MRHPARPASPESPPASVRTAGRGRLAPVLRLALAGTMVVALLGPVDLSGWTESRAWLAQSSSVQTVIEDLDQGLAKIGFHGAYDWLRRQTRALQSLRFNAGVDNQQ